MPLISLAELQSELEVSRPWVLSRINEGMPVASRRPYKFDADQAAAWLIQNGHVFDPASGETIHRTRAAIANAIGVSPRTVSDWSQDPSFPGRMGDALTGDGYFPEQAIRAWWTGRQQSDGAGGGPLHEARARQLAARAALDELKLQERRGELVELEVVTQEVARALTIARQKLTPLAEILFRMLPEEMPELVKGEFRRRVELAVDEACDSIATAIEREEEDI